MHNHGIYLVYGAGTRGIMGEVAKTLVELSGPEAVLGIIPDALRKHEQQGESNDPAKEAAREKTFGKSIVVPDMHTRKDLMTRKVLEGGPGSGFVALSGGFGTMEELMEVTTWNQLGIHDRGIVVYSVDGFWDGIMQYIKKAVEEGFITPQNSGIIKEAADAETAIRQLSEYAHSEDRLKLDWNQK